MVFPWIDGAVSREPTIATPDGAAGCDGTVRADTSPAPIADAPPPPVARRPILGVPDWPVKVT